MLLRNLRSIAVVTSLGALGASAFACSANNGNTCADSFGDGCGEGGALGMSSGAVINGSGNGSGNASGTDSTSTFVGTGTGSGTGSGGSQGCTGLEVAAEPKPVDIFIQFDKSGSMGDDNKWSDASSAMNAFFQDPGSAGISIALHFFPTGSCDESQCDVNDCATPDVPIGKLTADPAPTDAQEAALVQAVDNQSPGGGTPTRPALQGAENWATMYQAAHKGEQVVVLFVTDGIPDSDCDDTESTIPPIAAAALASDGVLTYAVGLEGSQQSFMDAIAQAGGTMASIQIQAGSMAEQQLIAALKAIQNNSVACQYQIPPPSMGQQVDPSKVNVTYVPSMGMSVTLGQVANMGACAASGGWYYDDPTNPTTITLCPTTCDTVQADQMAQVKIVLGCSTVVQ